MSSPQYRINMQKYVFRIHPLNTYQLSFFPNYEVNMYKKLNPMIGDRVYRSKGLVMHVGVMVDRDLVAHNSPDNNVEVISMEHFSQGKKVELKRSIGVDPTALKAQLQRISEENRRYCPISFNCEHFANELLGTKDGSEQLLAALLVGSFGLTCKNKWLGLATAGATGLLLCNGLRKYSTT
ncbi:hypothetical protein Shew_1265 [Shewanella loihica PV-4]|uniref:LRAT domain-containing protein n=2 Tax=Shewanella TaxID=22 RepID=A3QCD7_SHELP|nr:hypothetical protein Shew_1265 [Shewanella loihica PV-4]